MANIVLYELNCPKCGVLKQKLEAKGIKYTTNSNTDDMRALGIHIVPMLQIDGKLMNFPDAVKWVNEQ